MMKGLALLMCFVTLLTAIPAFATDKTPEMIGDLVVSRPLGIAATIAGAAIFVLALPFAATSRSVKKTAHELVRKPFYYTFERPLGEYTSRYIDPPPPSQDAEETARPRLRRNRRPRLRRNSSRRRKNHADL